MIRRSSKSYHQSKQCNDPIKKSSQTSKNFRRKLFNELQSVQKSKKPYKQSLQQITNTIHKKPQNKTLANEHTKSSYHNNSKPLKQESLEYKIKSQTSLTDLSEIAPIECSQRKQLSLLSEIKERFIVKDNHDENFCENSLEIDDFQILDVYAGANLINSKEKDYLNTKMSKDQYLDKNTSKAHERSGLIKNERKSGGIRKNSVCRIKQPNIVTQAQYSHYDLPKINVASPVSDLRKFSAQIPIEKDDQLMGCASKLFYAISCSKTVIQQSDFQVCPLNCEVKLILGPILTKFKQRKYTQLNLCQFKAELQSIMKDFSSQERSEITDKIMSDNFKQNSYQTNQLNNQTLHTQSILIHQQEEKQFNKTQERLQKLRSKVDSYINKINDKYNCPKSNSAVLIGDNYLQNVSRVSQVSDQSKKYKLSTLMSRLSQIEEISGDSDDILSEQQSSGHSESIQLDRNAYFDEDFQNRHSTKQIEEHQISNDISRNTADNFDSRYFRFQNGKQQKRNNMKIGTKRFSYELDINGVSSQRQQPYRMIQQRLFSSSEPTSANRTWMRNINFEFNQLSKYC